MAMGSIWIFYSSHTNCVFHILQEEKKYPSRARLPYSDFPWVLLWLYLCEILTDGEWIKALVEVS